MAAAAEGKLYLFVRAREFDGNLCSAFHTSNPLMKNKVQSIWYATGLEPVNDVIQYLPSRRAHILANRYDVPGLDLWFLPEKK